MLLEVCVAVLTLGSFSSAEACQSEGSPCGNANVPGCTVRAVCQDYTEIHIGEEQDGCRQCQRPCSEQIYIRYSSKEDHTPATGWYNWMEDIRWGNYFYRSVDNYDYYLQLKEDNIWHLTELVNHEEQREITSTRIQLSYKNDTRTLISLDNFGIGENERRNLNIFVAPTGNMKEGVPYEEKLVMFCPGKCMCKKFRIKKPFPLSCFQGDYKRKEKDSNNQTEQSKQEHSIDNSLTSEETENNHSSHSRSKRAFKGFKPAVSDETENNHLSHSRREQSFKGFKAAVSDETEDNHSSHSKRKRAFKAFEPAARNNEQSITTSNSSNIIPNKTKDPNDDLSQPNNWYARNAKENKNWKAENYEFASETYGDQPFEFIFDEEYQVWFVGKRRKGREDDIIAVIPEATPCPEMIQKQEWYVINRESQLELGMNITIDCLERD